MCIIYGSRPDNCRDFPGKRMCDLAENPLYKHLSDNSENKRVKLLLKNAPTSETAAATVKEAQQKAAETFKAISEKQPRNSCSTS